MLDIDMLSSISEDLTRSFESSLFNEEARSMNVEEYKNIEASMNIIDNNHYSGLCFVIMGSRAEGTSLQLEDSDIDILTYQDFIEADPGKCMDHMSSNDPCLCMVKSVTTPIGYTNLQIYHNGKPAKTSLGLERYCSLTLREDNNQNFFVGNISKITARRHGPAVRHAGGISYPIDFVHGFACKDLPDEVTPWFQRKRPYGWPSPATCELFKKMGCFVVRVGHLKSSEQDLEWRISFSYQERHLMLNLNPTQYRCYILLKLIKEVCLNKLYGSDIISSYHCKTALFYTIENNRQIIWRPDNLSVCLLLCLQQLYEWIEEKNCPNYFIPKENMFETKLSDEQKVQNVKTALIFIFSGYFQTLKTVYASILLNNNENVMIVKANARKVRNSLTDLTRYSSDLKPSFAPNIKMVISWLEDFMEHMETIREALKSKEQVTTFQPFTEQTLRLLLDNPLLVQDENNINILCSNKNRILEMFKHEKQKIRSTIFCLLLAKFLQDTGNELGNSLEGMKYEKEALKDDACQYYMKKASVFFKKCQYCLCSETITKSMIIALPIILACNCDYSRKKRTNYQGKVYEERLINRLKTTLTSDMNEEESLYKITPKCLTFDTSEMNMVPIPLTFEGYRSFGIPKPTAVELYWYDFVVIDPSVYLRFLQYKNYELWQYKKKLEDIAGVDLENHTLNKLENIAEAGNHALNKLEDISDAGNHALNKSEDIAHAVNHALNKLVDIADTKNHALNKLENIADAGNHALEESEDIARSGNHAFEKSEDIAGTEKHALEKSEDIAGTEKHALEKSEAIAGAGNCALEKSEAIAGAWNHALEKSEDIACAGNHALNKSEDIAAAGTLALEKTEDIAGVGNHALNKSEDTAGAGNHALNKLENIILDGLQCCSIFHLETALNALGHIYVTKGWYKLALQCFKQSWVKKPSHNAAKWHVVFMLFAEK